MPRRVTLADLAQAAGVGKSTVSRAMANHPACAAGTRERIQNLAAQMGYTPDPALSALVSHRLSAQGAGAASCNLAIITDVSRIDDYVRALWRSAKIEASRLGYTVQFVSEETMENPAALGRMLQARGVRGIVWAWLKNPRFLDEFPWDKFAHVGFLLPVVRPAITRVGDDSLDCVVAATQACFQRGFRRPGLALMTSRGSANDRFQQAGWLLAHAEQERAAVPIWRSFERRKTPIGAWARDHKLDVVIGNSGGVLWELRAAGLRTPGEVEFLNLLHPGKDHPGFDCREDQIGRVLVNVLDRQLRHNDLGLQENPHTILVRRKFLGWDSRSAD